MKKKIMDISNIPLEEIRTKKVSFNIEVQALELTDDLVKLLKSNRTVVLMGLIGLGIPSYIDLLKTNWNKIKKSNPEKKSKIDTLLKELSKIEEKHVKRSY
jgi:hypothetical protein